MHTAECQAASAALLQAICCVSVAFALQRKQPRYLSSKLSSKLFSKLGCYQALSLPLALRLLAFA
jgi:hypothetical protein